MQTQETKNKAVKVSVSIYSDQIERMRQVLSQSRGYAFSRFIQTAIDEKLDRIDHDRELDERLKAAS